MIAVLRKPFRNRLEFHVKRNILGFYFLIVDNEELPFSAFEIDSFKTI